MSRIRSRVLCVTLALSMLYMTTPEIRSEAAGQPGGGLWYVDEVGAPEACRRIRAEGRIPGQNIIVAVPDTGVETTHPALAGRLWENKAEKKGKAGVDDDKNGYVDDIYGANVYNPAAPMEDSHGHGTQMAGLIAAVTDDGAGVSSGVKIMPIKIGAGKEFSVDAVVEAVRYAVKNGADIINMSFATTLDRPALREALGEAAGHTVLVAAAGNENDTTEKPSYPAGYDFVTGVMSHGMTGKISKFSNWDSDPGEGVEYDLASPGEKLYSPTKGEAYVTDKGTSHAAAVTSGVMALGLAELRAGGVDFSIAGYGKWFAGAIRHTTTGDYLHGYYEYPKLYLPDVLDRIAEGDLPPVIPTAEPTAAPAETEMPTVSPTESSEPTAKPQKALKKGKVVKAGTGKKKAYYKVYDTAKKTVVYQKCMTRKTLKGAVIPASIRLPDGCTYRIVKVRKKAFVNKKNVKRVTVYASVTKSMMKRAIRGSKVKKIVYKRR